ncbi:MAG: CoA transferase [Gemmatimonadetes bacterium]|nr:CoA transferase [Gemmatimonadota bacterium]
MKPFAGILVLDITHVLAGPFATCQLGLLGADVIKVENPLDPDQSRHAGASSALNRAEMGTNYLAQNSNKRSLTLDLKDPRGREILLRLARQADVLVENYRAGALTQLGLGAPALRELNPRLIYCSMTGFGQAGPRGTQTAYDHAIQASSGILAVTGTAEGEAVKAGAPAVDYATGMMAAFAIASALFQRERTGIGQTIDVSMFDTALLLQSSHITGYFASGKAPRRRGNDHTYASSNLYATKDGEIMLGAGNLREHTRLFEALGRPDLGGKDYEQRAATNAEERAFLAEAMMERTAQEWEDFLQSRHVPALKVRGLPDALGDGQLDTRAILHRHESVPGIDPGPTVPGTSFLMEHDGPVVEFPPPLLGEHTAEILEGLGYDQAEIEALKVARIV